MKKLRYFSIYCVALILLKIFRILPRCSVKIVAVIIGNSIAALSKRNMKMACANIKIAFPELSDKEHRRIAKASFRNLIRNMGEFIWMAGVAKRIERCTWLSPEITAMLRGHVERGERIIFITPHLGSWEASGIMAPHFAGVNMVAIAKPQSNPYVNKLLNEFGRESEKGLKIIFRRGAVRAALGAIRDGLSLGTLIDQNTRVRDGGVMVDFFGLKVFSSASPSVIKAYCEKNDIPVVMLYAACIRDDDGVIHARAEYLSKPFAEYADSTEMLNELMAYTEKYIRLYPEHYLWAYPRFRYIPMEATEEEASRYPDYAERTTEKFYRKGAVARREWAEKTAEIDEE